MPKVVSQLRNTLRNGALAANFFFWISQPFRSCEMRFTVLRNGTHVPKSGFAAVKSFAKWSFSCENGIFHALVVRSRFAAAKWESLCCEMALVCQNRLRSCENFRREGLEAANWFRSKVSISQRLRNLADPCFYPVFALFLLLTIFLQFLLQFLLILIIQKSILH